MITDEQAQGSFPALCDATAAPIHHLVPEDEDNQSADQGFPNIIPHNKKGSRSITDKIKVKYRIISIA
jgi:hypothetical protein